MEVQIWVIGYGYRFIIFLCQNARIDSFILFVLLCTCWHHFEILFFVYMLKVNIGTTIVIEIVGN
jgi:hypothetical protein